MILDSPQFQTGPIRHRLWFICSVKQSKLANKLNDKYFSISENDIDVKISAKVLEVDATSRSGLKDSSSKDLEPEMKSFIDWCNIHMDTIIA